MELWGEIFQRQRQLGRAGKPTRGVQVAFGSNAELEGSLVLGFGLGDDHKRIVRKLGVVPVGVYDLNHAFRAQGYRKDMGVKGAVAVLFGQRFIKSKKATTSNWPSGSIVKPAAKIEL